MSSPKSRGRRVTYEAAPPPRKVARERDGASKDAHDSLRASLSESEEARVSNALDETIRGTSEPRASPSVALGVLLRAGVTHIVPGATLRRIVGAAIREVTPAGSLERPPPLTLPLMLSIAGLSKRAHQRRAKAMGDASPEERENLDALHSVADDAGSGPVVPLATLRTLERTVGVNVQDVLDEYTDQHASASDLSASPTAADFDAACAASQRDRMVDLRSVPLDGLLDALALREEAEGGGAAGAEVSGGESPFSSFGRVRSPLLSDDDEDVMSPRAAAEATDKDEERAFLRTVQSFARTSRTVTARRESLHFASFGLADSPEEGSAEALQQRLGEIMDDAVVATEHRRDATDAFCLGQLHLHRATAADRLAKATMRRRFTLGGSTTPQRGDLSGFGTSARSARGAYDDLVESTPTPRMPADRSIATEHGVLPSQVVIGTRVMPATLQHFHLEHASRAATPSHRRSSSRGSRASSRALSVMEPSPRTQASVRRHMLNVSAGRSQKTVHYAPSPPRSMQPAASPSPKSLASPSPRPPESKHATPFARVALCPTSHSPAATCVRRYWQEAVVQDAARAPQPSSTSSSAQERTLVSAR